MDNDDEIRKIMQIKKLRKKFIESGIYQTIVGPTGPTGPAIPLSPRSPFGPTSP